MHASIGRLTAVVIVLRVAHGLVSILFLFCIAVVYAGAWRGTAGTLTLAAVGALLLEELLCSSLVSEAATSRSITSGRFQWRPAQLSAGIDPLRRIYDLRHTFALRAGISTCDLSRYMGASLTMIDRHYGHLARDGSEHAIHLLDALNAPEAEPWTLVDAAWTSSERAAVSADNGNGS